MYLCMNMCSVAHKKRHKNTYREECSYFHMVCATVTIILTINSVCSIKIILWHLYFLLKYGRWECWQLQNRIKWFLWILDWADMINLNEWYGTRLLILAVNSNQKTSISLWKLLPMYQIALMIYLLNLRETKEICQKI